MLYLLKDVLLVKWTVPQIIKVAHQIQFSKETEKEDLEIRIQEGLEITDIVVVKER